MTLTSMGPWMDCAACRDVDPEIFFPIGVTPSAGQLRTARAICARCRVRGECLTFALDTGQTAGVWAGTTEEQRRAMRGAMRGAVRGEAAHGVRA